MIGWLGQVADGCEMCRRFGSTAYHVKAIGGDDPADAFAAPLQSSGEDEGENGGSGQFAVGFNKWSQPNGLGSLVTLTYSFNNLLDGGLKDSSGVSLPADLIRGSIEEALGLWASVAPLKFVEVPDEGREPVTISEYPAGQFGQIRFSHLYYNGPDPATGSPTAKAVAQYPAPNRNLAGDVFFDDGDPWQEFGTLHEPDVLGAAIHEIGHTLGLAHSSVTTANMYWIFTRYSGLGTGKLQPDDIAGIQSIYGEGSGMVIPLAIHVPEPTSWTLGATGFLAGLAMWLRRRRERRAILPTA